MRLKEIDVNLIVVLDALLIDGSVTKAAERLGRSPSAISHALGNLREIFQDDLFVRAGQRLVPTAKAMSLASTVHVICVGIQSLLRPEQPFDPASEDRHFTLTCPNLFEPSYVPNMTLEVHNDAAGIVVDSILNEPDDIITDLREDRYQFVITTMPPETDAGDVCSTLLKSEPMISIAAAGHAFEGKRIGKKKYETAMHFAVSSRDKSIADAVDAALETTVVRHVPTPMSAVSLAKSASGIALLPKSVAQLMIDDFGMTEIRQPFPEITVASYLVWHQRFDHDEAHVWVRERLIAI